MPKRKKSKAQKIPLAPIVHEYTLEQREKWQKALKELRLGPLRAPLRKTLMAAGVEPRLVEKTKVIDEESLEVFKLLVNHEWTRLNQHVFKMFKVDTTELFRNH